MDDQWTTAYIRNSGEVKIMTTANNRTHSDVANLGMSLTVGVEFLSSRPYLASVRTVTATDALIDRSADLDRMTHGDPCLAQLIRRTLASG